MAGLIIVGGVILQIYDETQDAAQKMVRRQAAIDFAVSFVDQSSDLLRNAVRPENLDVDVSPLFAPDRFSVPAYSDPASNGLFLVTLRPREEAEAGHPYEIVRKSLADAGGSETDGETVDRFGHPLEGPTPSVSFRYAIESKPGVPVAYVDRLGAGQWPALVEISVEIPTGEEGGDPVRMKTAVIPGRLPAMAAAAPTPTPTPVPAAPLSPGQAPKTSSAGGAAPEAAPAEAAP